MDNIFSLAEPCTLPLFHGLPNATALCVTAILVFLAAQLISLHSKLGPKRKVLASSIAFLKAFKSPWVARDYANVNKHFESPDNALSAQWQEYAETLLVADPNEDPDQPICNTKQAENYFTLESIVERDFNSAWFAAVPSLLTAIGLFGTFLSIYLALSALQIKDDSFTNITGFINNLSGKFVSSIFGLGAAFVFTWVERDALGTLTSKISALHIELNRLTEQKPQEVLLQSMSDSLASWSGGLGNLAEFLPATIEDALRKTVQPQILEMTANLKSLQELTEKSVERRDESITRLVTQVVTAFREALLQETQDQFGTLAIAITKTIGIVEDFNSKMEASVEHSRRLFDQMKSWQEEQVALLLERQGKQQSEVLATLQEQLTYIAEEQKERQGLATAELVTSYEKLLKSNERSIETTSTKLSKAMEVMIEQSEASASKQLDLLRAKHEQMVNGLTSWIETSNDDLDKLLARIAVQTENTNRTVQSLGDLSKGLKESTDAYNEVTIKSKEILEQFVGAIDRLSASTSRLHEHHEGLSESLVGVAAQHQKMERLVNSTDTMLSKFESILASSKNGDTKAHASDD